MFKPNRLIYRESIDDDLDSGLGQVVTEGIPDALIVTMQAAEDIAGLTLGPDGQVKTKSYGAAPALGSYGSAVAQTITAPVPEAAFGWQLPRFDTTVT
ncbi:MAG: hypothetical protein Q8P27_00615 [Candidatus Peregrinibacteria bacterium]|nr:hypothetical protein [Candidatus Peregrinibacteria bacterium]